ncbi:hypothetical protein QFC24_001350 [Naganishia onofrii]|uniref:Uncharacterized protein n=1 Tax=Naganishia onofrii TaxID=1851511 RepID=A0ACC2XU32_9TREE|nr:hypothetical protein QFC24_001350 [Naganishia onofrii]
MGYWGYEDSGDEGQPDDESDEGGSDIELEKEEDGYETEGPLADLGRAMSQNQGESGEFSFGGPAEFLPSAPGLFIEGVGKVALPLMDDQTAEKIIQVCEQAPFGRGRETLVDVLSSMSALASLNRLRTKSWKAPDPDLARSP